MEIRFDKFHGAGNDFIMVDARDNGDIPFTESVVRSLCDRHFGIGADGLILLLGSENADFHMKYFNSDGREGTMCGNGGRCITSFAKKLGIIQDKARFSGIDGFHESRIMNDNNVSLRMIDVNRVTRLGDGYLLDTGSTHFVIFRNELHSLDVFREGREIRHQTRFGEAGTNVNFVQILNNNELNIRTYERGVEDETLACGTGAVASAICAYLKNKTDKNSFLLHARGGDLLVSFSTDHKEFFYDVWLEGPSEFVFEGEIVI